MGEAGADLIKTDASDKDGKKKKGKVGSEEKEWRPKAGLLVPGFCCHRHPLPLGPYQLLSACCWVSRPSLLCLALYLQSLTLWQ